MNAIQKLNPQPLKWLEALLADERLRGRDGRDGANGKDGLDGENGERGLTGADGKNGINGRDGAPGEHGERGLSGRDGVDGKHGEDGKDGKRGLKGQRGLRGLQGRRGKDGQKGEKGEKGDPPKHQIDKEKGTIRFERPDGSWGGWLEIKQIVKTEVFNGGGGGGARLTNAVQDIDGLRSGTFPDYGKITVTTVNLTLTDAHRHVVCKTNAVQIQLPPAATYYNATTTTGIIYSITNAKSNANDITLLADGSDTIDGESTWTVPPGASPKIQTDGTEWHIF